MVGEVRVVHAVELNLRTDKAEMRYFKMHLLFEVDKGLWRCTSRWYLKMNILKEDCIAIKRTPVKIKLEICVLCIPSKVYYFGKNDRHKICHSKFPSQLSITNFDKVNVHHNYLSKWALCFVVIYLVTNIKSKVSSIGTDFSFWPRKKIIQHLVNCNCFQLLSTAKG